MLTRQQQQALAFNRHISVTANAGAGKTTVLINRFLGILLETHAPVQQLVAITFTDKAASELRVKIAAEVKARLGKATGADRWRLEYIRDQLAGANIGTIHSFCAQLLRDFPVEANIDAGFTILEGVDQQFLINESYRESFDAILQGGTPLSNDLTGLLRRIGADNVERYTKTFIQKREQTERLLSGPLATEKSDEEILGRWSELTAGYVSELLHQRRVHEILEALLPHLGGKRAEECSVLIRQFLEADDQGDKISTFLNLTETLLTQHGTLRKVFNSGSLPPGTERAAGVLHVFRKKVAALTDEELSPASANVQLLWMTRVLLGFYREVMERYSAKKTAAGQLDFDDLEFTALVLLNNETVRTALSAKYRYLMIDEFQDTNYLQYEILQRLVAGIGTGNLFIVGDPKQSIYGFRNAEVEIFERSKTDIGRVSEGGFNGNVVLNESFRLLPAITDFINRVFSSTMGGQASPFDVGYEELISARGIAAEGNIRLFLVPPPEEGLSGGEDPIATECRMIARYLYKMFEERTLIHGKDNGTPRPFTFSDAAILVRQRRHLPEIERALTEFNIPYLLTGGIGYYQTQEIYDILNYLKFLINRDNEVALAGILRSPFFTISDSELFEISLEKGAETFWSKVRRHAGRKSSSVELRRAVAILTSHIELANRVAIPVLIQKALDDTGWPGIMSGLEHGRQSKANIDKLLHIANEFESRGFLSLYDFIERIKTLSEEEDREGQAAIEVATPSVHVMTVHAAKGLEFPVVILPFLDKQFRYDQQPYIDASTGIGFTTVKEEDFDTPVTPPICQYLKEMMNLRTEAEEKRIFYVATTRAMEHLVLAGVPGNLTSRPSYLGWMLEGLGIGGETLAPGKITLKARPCKILDRAHDNQIVEIQHPLLLEIFYPEEIGTHKGEKVVIERKNEFPEVILPEIRGTRAEEYFSATQITTFLDCPRKFYLRHVLGVPEMRNVPYNFNENDDANDKLEGDIVGSVVHKILEGINDSGWTLEVLRKRIGDEVRSFPSIRADMQPRYAKEVEQNVERFLNSEFGKEMLAFGESKTELSLTMAVGEDFLTGTIDKIFKNRSGQWEILDYKTDNISAGQIVERSEYYKPQLSVYCLLVSRYFHQPEAKARLVFLKHPDRPVQMSFDAGLLGEFEKSVKNNIKEIKGGEFPINPKSCPRCPYYLNGCLGK